MILLSALSLLAAAHAAPAPAPIEVTSFYYTNPEHHDRLAELCGQINIPFTGNDRVAITVDISSNPGSYVTWPDRHGHFCVIVETQTGRAGLGLWNGTQDGHADATVTAVVR
jgi:hypothetical protein